jgi:superfamily II DNA/RNA helicase
MLRLAWIDVALVLLILSFETEAWVGLQPLRKHVDTLRFHDTKSFRRLSYEESSRDNDGVNRAVQPKLRRLTQRPIRQITNSTVSQQRTERNLKSLQRFEEALKDPTLLSEIKFDQIHDLSPAALRPITEHLGLHRMTEIQAKTWPIAFRGNSVLGRARTGTGKVR